MPGRTVKAPQSRIARKTGLTPLQSRFVEEYVKCCNGTTAMIKAGAKVTTKSSAGTAASKMLLVPKVAQEIERRFKILSMSAEEAVKRLTEIARGSMVPFIKVDEHGRVWFDLADPDAQESLHLIKKIKSQRFVEKGDPRNWEHEWVEVELHDAHAALRDILKMHGKIEDKLNISGKVEHEIRQVIKIGDTEVEF